MATYAVGDVQGCFRTLEALVDKIELAPGDRLWLAGDLVNRGPRSLQALRWARRHERLSLVLGNHELHLLACADGVRKLRKSDTVAEILEATDVEELLEWLRQRPLLVESDGWLMVHAGLLPGWTVAEARRRARAAERVIACDGPERRQVLGDRGIEPDDPLAEIRETVATMTRIRMVDAKGRPRWHHKGSPADAPPGQCPWFEAREPKWAGVDVVFGHWAALGRYLAPPVHAIDSGCVWGVELTALRLDDRTVFTQENID